MPSTSSSQSIYETVEGCHAYEIKGYSLAQGMGVGKFMTSGKFTVGGYDWVVIFFPDGCAEATKESVAVFVKLVSPGEVRASNEFRLLDPNGNVVYIKGSKSPLTFKEGTLNSSWGYDKFEKKSMVETYLKDDCLSVHCTVGVVKARVEEGKHYVIPVPPSNMSQHRKNFLKSEIGYDITFQVSNEFFRAHKWILAARSLVFRAQFFGLVGNPNMETVVIEEFDPFAFKAMLLFIYSDELPETHELADSKSICTSNSLMQHLLVAADRFDLARLKILCEAKLCEELTADTVADTLAVAERHQCLQIELL